MQRQSVVQASPRYVRDASNPRRLERALADIRTGFAQWRLAAALAWLDIRNRYRGSVLGPLWLTLSTAVMVVSLGVLYASLFKLQLSTYLPFLVVSLLLWNTINQIVIDACTSLTASESIVRQVALPFTVHILRCVLRNAIVAAHSLPLILVVFLTCGALPGRDGWLALPGLVLLALDACAGALLLGMVCARFRDVQQIVASGMQLCFFLSPVIWKPELLGAAEAWLPLNPFYAVMETMRGPLLDSSASLLIWTAALVYSGLLCGAAFGFFVRFRTRIAFWV